MVPGNEVDHIVPIKVAPDRRLDPTNLQTMCKPHHSAKTWRENRLAPKATIAVGDGTRAAQPRFEGGSAGKAAAGHGPTPRGVPKL